MAYVYRFNFKDLEFDELAFSVSSTTLGFETPGEIEKQYKAYRAKERHPSPKDFVAFLHESGYYVKEIEIDYVIEWDLEEDDFETDDRTKKLASFGARDLMTWVVANEDECL